MANNDVAKIPQNDFNNNWDTLQRSITIATDDENYKAVGSYIIGVAPIAIADAPDQNSWEFEILYNLQGQLIKMLPNIAA